MNKQATGTLYHGRQSHPRCTEIEARHEAIVSPEDTKKIHPATLSRAKIERRLDETSPEAFLKVIQAVAPSAYEPLSRVLADHELWMIFREKAAETFCKADASYYLKYIPAYPLCIAMPAGCMPSLSSHPCYRHGVVTFEDLAKLADKILMNTGR